MTPRALKLLLIKPSKYDDDGYVVRFVRGVLPSNTLATLAALTEDVVERGELPGVRVEVVMLDEQVERVDPERLARAHRKRGTRVIAALCGVQTNQFPRAADLAAAFRALDVPVLLGGFHVSGALAMSPGAMPPECRALIDLGVTLVKGEIEDRWGAILRDALAGTLAPLYDIVERPDLSRARVPVVSPRLMRRYAYPYMGTIDAARGCPFNCSFCTIINVQGRAMRHRPPGRIIDRIRRNAARKIDYYFFTDDNFARNPEWEAILDGLAALRRDEGIAVQFMMQVDTTAHRIPRFVEKAAAAGCSQVFLGVETLHPENIAAAGKRQNHVEAYRAMTDAWHAAGVACHTAFIVGFPFDTPESIRDDARRLRDEIGADQASFFMLMPIPGSRDHAEKTRTGAWMDPDLNRYDSTHATTTHPRMSAEAWLAAYRDAWDEFYSLDGMKAILARANDVTYWGLFKNFVWYRYSTRVEATHPMLGGFFRLKDRRQRRPGLPVEGRIAHARRRWRDGVRWARGVAALYFEMQEVWLATRGAAQIQRNVDVWKRRADAMRRRVNPLRIRAKTRADLDAYWRQTRAKLRRGRLWAIDPLRLAWNLVRDVRLCLRFNVWFLVAFGK